MKNKRNILCGAFAVLALSLAGGSLAFTANAEETAAKTLADISIGMVKGASMRIGSAEEGNTEESTGLRFTMQVSKADYEALDKTQYENIEWGMLIAPVESVKAAEFNAENLFGSNAKYVFNEETAAEGKYAAINVTEAALTPASETNLKIDNADNYYVFSGYMHTIKAGNLTRGFVGRGYVKYTVKGEETPQYKFAEYFGGNAENNTRSAYYVAQKYVSDAAVTDTDAKNYVRTNYLENAVALKTASVNITANDYLEDITVGTYKTEVSETNTVTAKIGEKYDLSAESNAKEGYALREELSSATTPVYRGQQLSIKRYYEADGFIPFSSAGAITAATIEDGEEFAGAYKFTGTRLQLASGDLKNYKVLKGVTVPEDGKVHLVNYVTMKAYYTTYGAFNLVSQLGDGVIGDNKWAVSVDWYDSSEGGVGDGYKLNESKVAYYDENGYRTFKLNTNTWYTVAFPVHTNYHDSARFGGMYWDLPANNTLYFKDVKIENKAVDPFDVPAAYADFVLRTNGTSTVQTDVSEGNFTGAKKVELTKGGWVDGIVFTNTDMIDNVKSNVGMFEKGIKYISLDVYFTGATTGVYFWDNICKDKQIENTATLGEALPSYNYTFAYNNGNVWGKWGGFNSGKDKTAEIVRFYDKAGNKVDTLQKDTWYTIIIMRTSDKNGYWGNMKLMPKGGSEETPAIMYYNNLRYSCVDPKA